jgi:hypothetical protein
MNNKPGTRWTEPGQGACGNCGHGFDTHSEDSSRYCMFENFRSGEHCECDEFERIAEAK